MTSKKLLFLLFQNLVFSKDHRRGGYLRRRLPLLLCPRVGQQVLQKMAPPAQSPQAASPHQHLHRGGGGFRALEPHSFFADPDPAVLLNADPDTDPALKKNLSNDETFSGVEKDKKDCSKLKS